MLFNPSSQRHDGKAVGRTVNEKVLRRREYQDGGRSVEVMTYTAVFTGARKNS
jgi:hypothetical protein